MLRSTKWTVRIADFFFDEPLVDLSDVDIVRYLQMSHPVPDTEGSEFATILIDLTRDEQWLLAHVRNNTRYEIVRARDRDALEYQYWRSPEPQCIDAFAEFFNRSAAVKNQPPVGRERLRVLCRAGALDLSVMRHEGKDLVWHAHHYTSNRVRLLETASLFRTTDDAEYRKLVARANRYHHWRGMLRFKSDGVPIYDFGGYARDTTDPELLGINRFKEGFGGEVVTEYLCHRGVTLRGKLALAVQNRTLRLQKRLAPGSLTRRFA